MGIDEKDIEAVIANEIRVINKLSENGGNPNIVTVLEHRWMGPGDIYVLDMELCELNLGQFIGGGYITAVGQHYFDPVPTGVVPECLTMWTIMRHITLGLEHIHGLRQVHRDLKPQNGTLLCHLLNSNAVLLSVTDCAWKLTDFGLTFEGTSRVKYTTKYSQGSVGYRAVELLNIENPFFTKASDIWALGCILFELSYQKKAFPDDIAAWESRHEPHRFKGLPRLQVGERLTACIRELIRRTLEIDWWKRPTGRDVLQLLNSLSKNTSESVFYLSEAETGSSTSSSSIPFPDGPVSFFDEDRTRPSRRASQAPEFYPAGANSLLFLSDIEKQNSRFRV